MLIAWMTIFMHNVIPHNHVEDIPSGCHDIVHATATDKNDCGKSDRIVNIPGEITVCHFSAFLFHNINHENLIAGSSQELILDPLRIGDTIFPCEDQSYISDNSGGSLLFRAPPTA